MSLLLHQGKVRTEHELLAYSSKRLATLQRELLSAISYPVPISIYPYFFSSPPFLPFFFPSFSEIHQYPLGKIALGQVPWAEQTFLPTLFLWAHSPSLVPSCHPLSCTGTAGLWVLIVTDLSSGPPESETMKSSQLRQLWPCSYCHI